MLPPGYVVDSFLPIDNALRRFRANLPATNELSGGATSRDALVARFARALERGDSVALEHMELTRAEFAYLVYPSSIYTRPPYRQQPEIVWALQRADGAKGYRRLVQRVVGRRLRYDGYHCLSEPEVHGENRLWLGCALRYRDARGQPANARLFGAIVERDGRFKFVSYANDL